MCPVPPRKRPSISRSSSSGNSSEDSSEEEGQGNNGGGEKEGKDEEEDEEEEDESSEDSSESSGSEVVMSPPAGSCVGFGRGSSTTFPSGRRVQGERSNGPREILEDVACTELDELEPTMKTDVGGDECGNC